MSVLTIKTMTAVRPKRVHLEVHQLRTMLEVCKGTSELSNSTDRDSALKEAGQEAKNILWKAIDSQRISKMTKVTLKSASSAFKKRKHVSRVKKELLKLMQEHKTTQMEVGRELLVVRKWEPKIKRNTGLRMVDRIIFHKATPYSAYALRELCDVNDELLTKAKEQLDQYDAQRAAASEFEADDCLEAAESYMQVGKEKLTAIKGDWESRREE